MDSTRAPKWRLRGIVFAAFAFLALPALAAGPGCTLKADINPQSLTMPDFVQTTSGWAPNAVKLNGAASKPDVKDGGIYQWTVLSGPAGYVLTDTGTAQPTFTPPDVGPSGAQYVIRLTVTGCGSSASLDYPVAVTNAHDIVSNTAPHAVASATPNPADENQLVALKGSDSYDPDKDTLAFSWEQLQGPAVTLSDAHAANPTFTAPNVTTTTTLKFRLTVSDGALTNATTVDVNITWLNEAPVANASCPLDVDEGQTVVLDGSASSDGDDGIASYRWTQGQGLPVVTELPANGAVISFPAPALGFQQVGLVPFTLTVTDASGVESSMGCSIFIHDVTTPAIDARPITADAESASGTHVAFSPAPSAFDAVDGDVSGSLECTPPSGSLFALGTTAVACTARDSAGNLASGGFEVTVSDLSAPAIAAHADIAVEATGPQGAAVAYDAPATSDKVDGAGTASCAPPPGVFPLGSTVVDCDAADKAGNPAATTHFTISVHDTTAPAITIPADITAEATGPAGAAVTFAVSASDLVDGSVAVSCDHVSGDTFPLGATVVQCSAHDSAVRDGFPQGNLATSSFTVTVQDTQPPTLSLPADVVAEADKPQGKDVVFAASASDVVDPDVIAVCTPVSGSTFGLGTTTVACSATDASGNTAGGSFTVTVRDTTAPALVLPSPVTLEATGPVTPLTYGAATASDLVDTDVAVSCAPTSGSGFAVGATIVTCTATDDAGNASSGTVTMTVTDTTAPALSLPANITAEATSASGAIVAYGASASDLVDGARAATCTPASGSTFALGITTVGCSATDTRGNTAHGGFTVKVQDTTAPVLQGHADITVTATSASGAVVTYTLPTASDAVDASVDVVCTPASGGTFPLGQTTVTCIATDDAGNPSTSSFKVNVLYGWNGFFRPIDNAPVVNGVKAGSAVPVKFSLGGNMGLGIFESGYPKPVTIACSAGSTDPVEETLTAGSSSLSYDATANQYVYVWKTDKAWAGSCRKLQLRMADGTVHEALFTFTR